MTDERCRPALSTGVGRLDQRWVALAWAGAAFAAPLNGVRVTRSFTLGDVLLCVAVIATVASRRRESADLSTYGKVLGGLALLTAGALLGTAFGPYPWASLVGTAKFVFTAVGSCVAVVLWSPPRAQLRWFFASWLGGAVVTSLWALVASPSVAGRPIGLTSHPNSLGLVCVLGVGVALGFRSSGRRLSNRLAVACAVVLAAGLVASGSRGALLGLAAAAPLAARLSSKSRLALPCIAAAVLVGAVITAGVVHTPAPSVLGRLGGDRSTEESDAERLQQLSRSVERVRDRPLTGEGFANAHEAHNIYLQALVAAGPLGLIGIIVSTGSVLVVARRAKVAHRGATGPDAVLLSGVAGGYVGYLVAALFENNLSDRSLWLYSAGILTLVEHMHPVRMPVFVAPRVTNDGPGPSAPPAVR